MSTPAQRAFRDDDLRRYLGLRADAVAAGAATADAAATVLAERLGMLRARPRRTTWALRFALLTLLLLAALAAALFLVGREREQYVPDQPQSTVPLRGSPWAVAAAQGSVWVGAYREPLIFRLDPRRGEVLAEIDVGRPVCGQLEAGFEYLWFSDCGGLWLSRLDPATGKVARLAGYGTDRVAFGDGGVWVPYDGAIERLDPQTLATTLRVVVDGAGLMAFGSGSVWLSDADRGVVVRVDPETARVVATVTWGEPDLRRYPVHIVAHDEAVWVVDEQQLRVYRIDPMTNEATPLALELQPIDGTGFGDHPIAAGAGQLWVRESDRSLARIDTTSLEVVDRLATVASGGGAFAVTGGALWVANLKDQTVTGVRRP